MVDYYHDMWGKRSEILVPLASLTSKSAKWKWEAKHQKAFDDMKAMITKEALLAYPDFAEEFVIHTDASHTQLSAVILQRGKPIAFYSRKLKPKQTQYTTTERELLSIVETLKEFCNILLRQKIVVYTDHKNLTCKTFNTERVMCWRLMLKEYSPELCYNKGECHVVADALSRLDMLADHPVSEEKVAEMFATDSDTGTQAKVFPLVYSNIEDQQKKNPEIQKAFQDKKDLYKETVYPCGDHSYMLITKNDKIFLPKAHQTEAVKWYHGALMHPGET
jgi:RNase H-like domain found in reverse transcriptase